MRYLLVIMALMGAMIAAPGTSRAQTVEVDTMEAIYVARENVNIRAAPGTQAERLGSFAKGDMVVVTGKVRAQDWLTVTLDDGRQGFVFLDLLEPLTTRSAPESGLTRTVVLPKAPDAPPAEEPVTKAPEPEPEPIVEPAVAAATAPLGEAFRDCTACPEMVPLPAGRFTMGARAGLGSEGPAHGVTISRAFAIGRFEVTVGQWKTCVADGACKLHKRLQDAGDDDPVRYLSHDDAVAYVSWLGRHTGKAYRLPSEAEWEYAARAGTTTAYWWGDAPGLAQADCKDCGGEWNRKAPSASGRFPANAFGLQDTSGGVAEWVADCWHGDYRGAPGDGSVWEADDCRQRVLRGGSWRNDATYLRSAARGYYDAPVAYSANGLRVALTLP